MNLFKANKKDTKKYLMLTFIKLLPSSVVSIADLEQENTNWVVSLLWQKPIRIYLLNVNNDDITEKNQAYCSRLE